MPAKLFEIRDNQGASILGRPVSRENSHIVAMIPIEPEMKIDDLPIGGECACRPVGQTPKTAAPLWVVRTQ